MPRSSIWEARSFMAGRFTSGITSEMMQIARASKGIPLGLDEKYSYVTAPTETKDTIIWGTFNTWTRKHGAATAVRFKLSDGKRDAKSTADLARLESEVKIVGIYCWLSRRWPEFYPDCEVAAQERTLLNSAIMRALKSKSLKRTCTTCGCEVKWSHEYGICEGCYAQQRVARRRDYYDDDDDFYDSK